ncbi:hypothetical protein FQ377_13580 [Arthrobacter echini]|uniref:Uncharacterized protein n=1 Tax=Arthrobacter echini TaxID=1529066 RepID=A0A5D0XK18_9MICC|nr:hypothetical protein [Arthrobacter echini]TYC96618.1 hypothetical protein FQ377_13580 [Arthrobacter echini]
MNDAQIQAQIVGTPLEPILLWTREHGDRPDHSGGFDQHEVVEAMEFFARHKLISDEFSVAAGWDLLPKGRRIADAIIESRTSGALRDDALEKGLLRFITEQHPDATEKFIGQLVEGIAVTKTEHADTAETLRAGGHIIGTEAYGYDGLSGPKVTGSGRRRMRRPGLPGGSGSDGVTTIYDNSRTLTNNGQMGVGAVGDDITQSGNTFIAQTPEIGAILKELRTLLVEVGDTPPRAREALDDMELEVRSTSGSVPALQAAYGAFVGSVAAKLGEESYSGISDLVTTLYTMIFGG